MILMETAGAELSPFFAWLLSQLYAIAGIRTPILTAVFSVLTYLGHEMGFLLVAIVLTWCLNKKYGYRLLIIFMVGSFLQQILKSAFMIPRPWILDPAFDAYVVQSAKGAATGFSFPSGHTMTACMSLGALAMFLKKKWAYAAAAVLVLLVAFSRMYLGVHTLLDVVVGLLFGVLLLGFFELALKGREGNDKVLNTYMYIGFGLCVCLMAYLLIAVPDENASIDVSETHTQAVKDAAKLVGAALGMVIGKLIDDRFIHFDTETVWWKQIVKVCVGMAIIIAIWGGLKLVFPKKPLFDGIRYFGMSFVGIGVYPILFRKLFPPKAAPGEVLHAETEQKA